MGIHNWEVVRVIRRISAKIVREVNNNIMCTFCWHSSADCVCASFVVTDEIREGEEGLKWTRSRKWNDSTVHMTCEWCFLVAKQSGVHRRQLTHGGEPFTAFPGVGKGATLCNLLPLGVTWWDELSRYWHALALALMGAGVDTACSEHCDELNEFHSIRLI